MTKTDKRIAIMSGASFVLLFLGFWLIFVKDYMALRLN